MHSNFQSDLQHVIEAFRLPGMAVVVVEQGDVVFSQGFGYANIEEGQPFTDETVCLAASVTKSFTASLAGCLVDRGAIDWTRPVREYIPRFRMVDEFASREITLSDMLCHRSGLPWHENLLAHGVGRELADSGRTYRADLLKRLAYFEPSSSFRTHFQYQDIVYTCAGAILEHVANQAYEELVAHYLLQPLGMQTSTFVRASARANGRLAQGYAFIDGRFQPIPFCDTRYIAPAAGLYSSAKEMVPWLKLQLGRGHFENTRVLSENSFAWIHRPHMVVPGSAALGGGVTAYGHGWFQSNLHGHTVIGHGGSFNGYRSFVGFVPEKEAGVVVFTNLNLTEGAPAAGLIVLDQLLGADAVEQRIAFYQKRALYFRDLEEREARAFAEGRDLMNPSPYEPRPYQGNYRHPGYGEFTITLEKGTLYQTYDGRTYPLAPYSGNTFASSFQSTENRLLDMTFTFESDGQGNIIALSVPLVPDIPTPRFLKEP